MFNSLDHLIIAVEDLDKATQNYQLIMGVPPVWSGEHKSLGTSNTLFNFQNTYLELLSATGEGLGADLINYYLKDTGEGLIGIVFATNDIKDVHQSLQNQGFLIGEPTDGEGINSADQKIRKWKNLFLPPDLTRGIFSFRIGITRQQGLHSGNPLFARRRGKSLRNKSTEEDFPIPLLLKLRRYRASPPKETPGQR